MSKKTVRPATRILMKVECSMPPEIHNEKLDAWARHPHGFVVVKNNKYVTVKDAIEAWATGDVSGVDGLKIGQNVSPYEIGAAVSDRIPQIYVKSVKIALHEETPAAAELTCTVAQIYTIAESDITVTVE